MSRTARKTDRKPLAEMTPQELAAYARTLRDEARGLPYDPNDNSLLILATELGCSSTRH
jgi:hypothetical protein